MLGMCAPGAYPSTQARTMTRHERRLALMFVLGLPGLPMATLGYLVERFVVAYEDPPATRSWNKRAGFVSLMCTCTVFELAIAAALAWTR